MGENEGRRFDDRLEENSLTVKWSFAITVVISFTVLVLGFFGWLLQGTMSLADRVARLETKLEIQLPQINASLEKQSVIMEAIRNDQLRRRQKEK